MIRRSLLLLAVLAGSVLPCRAQDAPTPSAVTAVPPGARSVATVPGAALRFQTAGAVVTPRAVLPHDGSARWAAADAQATALLSVAPAPEGPASLELAFYTEAPGRPWRARHTLALPTDTPYPVAVLRADGALAYVLPATARLVLLDAAGTVTHDAPLFKDAPYTLERTVLLATHPTNGDRYVAAVRVPDAPDRPGEATLFCYRADGTVRWQRALPAAGLQGLSVDPTGRHLAVAVVNAYAPGGLAFHTLLLGTDGAASHTLDAPFARARWSADGEAVLLVRNGAALWVDVATGAVRQRFAAPLRGHRWVDAAMDPDGTHAVLLAARTEHDGTAYVHRDARLYAASPDDPPRALLEAGDGAERALHATADAFALVTDAAVYHYAWEVLR